MIHTPNIESRPAMHKPKSSKKPVSAYDRPTPEKKEFGARMREAREEAGINQADAAKLLGYSQAVQLSNMEAGNRMPPLAIIIAAAKLYGTTTDFLCGLADDSDRDPAAAMSRWMAARIHADVSKIARDVVGVNVELMRKVMPSTAEGQRLAAAALEVTKALETFRTLNPKFDTTMRGSASLAQKVEAATAVARSYQGNMARAIRLLHIRSMRDAVVASGGPPTEQHPLGLSEPEAPAHIAAREFAPY